MRVADRVRDFRDRLTSPDALVAVSKRHPVDAIRAAYEAGQRAFGENYGQELRDKARVLPEDIAWHFIGPLQRNKLKYIAPVVTRVHTLTERSQVEALLQRAPAVAGLIQVDLAGEVTKNGVRPESVRQLADDLARLEGFTLTGLMALPPWPEAPEDSRPWFRSLAELLHDLRRAGHAVDELSMGTTADWQVALEEGATWIRVGTALFGPRPGQ